MQSTTFDYEFKLENFQGPLDLLLHLLKQKKMEILDISISEITQQYINFIYENMEKDIEVISEYLTMAAYLIEIKSKALLPKKLEEIDSNYEEMQKAKLIASLLEYEQYKKASESLSSLESERFMYFDRPEEQLPSFKPIVKEIFDIDKFDMEKLFKATSKMIERIKAERPIETKIEKPKISIEERTEALKKIFIKNINKPLNFIKLFDNFSSHYIAITFLAILDLTRLGKLVIEQKEEYGEILITYEGGFE